MELLHAVLVIGSWFLLVVSFCWGLGWGIEEIEEALDVRQQRRREHARLAIRQARAMHEVDRISTAAVAELLRIAGEELSYA